MGCYGLCVVYISGCCGRGPALRGCSAWRSRGVTLVRGASGGRAIGGPSWSPHSAVSLPPILCQSFLKDIMSSIVDFNIFSFFAGDETWCLKASNIWLEKDGFKQWCASTIVLKVHETGIDHMWCGIVAVTMLVHTCRVWTPQNWYPNVFFNESFKFIFAEF